MHLSLPLPLPRRPDVLLARPAAVVMAGCAAVHGWCAVRHWAPALSMLTITVALACLLCGPHLWRAPRTADWVLVTVGSAAMLALHLLSLAAPAGGGHAHAGAALPASGGLDTLSTVGLILPLLGLASAWWALAGRAPRAARLLGVGVPVDDQRPDRGHHG